MRQLVLACLITILAPGQEKANGNDDGGPVQAGYAIVTPVPATTESLVVFETFGLKRKDDTTQAGILPSQMTTSALLFVNASGRLSRNLGVAIANPGAMEALVNMTLRGNDGTTLGSITIPVGARQQVAQFVTEMFADRPEVARDLTGTLSITSNNPVAVVGLRFRGENFSTLPITNLSLPIRVPERTPGVGGQGAVILAHVAAGGGWASEIVLANSGSAPLTVRVDLFKQDGTPLIVELNGVSASGFTNLTIPSGGVVTLAPRDNNGDSRF